MVKTLLALPLAAVAAGATYLAACHLSPTQAAEAKLVDGPACQTAGGVVALELPGLQQVVALLCKEVADDIIQTETIAPATGSISDAGPSGVASDGGSTPDAGTAFKASRSRAIAAPGCKVVPIPNDPLRQRACAELHPRVLSSSVRVVARHRAAR